MIKRQNPPKRKRAASQKPSAFNQPLTADPLGLTERADSLSYDAVVRLLRAEQRDRTAKDFCEDSGLDATELSRAINHRTPVIPTSILNLLGLTRNPVTYSKKNGST